MKIHWPTYDPSLLPEEVRNAPNFEAEWQSFLRPARDVVFMSTDRMNWTRLDARIEGHALLFEAVMPEEEVCWFSVTLYYTPTRLKNLMETVSENPFVTTEIIGRDEGGDAIPAFRVTDPSGPDDGKTTVYLQGTQHCSEYNGAHLIDFMIRYLASGCPEARRLMKKYRFCMVPVVSVTSWRMGLDVHASGLNPNRDWIDQALPTTRAVHNWLSKMTPAPKLLLDIHSGLANYGSWTICQALNVNTELDEEKQAAMRRFVDAVYEDCDFLPTRRYWLDRCTDAMFDGYGLRYGQTHTMEISHYAMYDRMLGHHRPIDMEGLKRFAGQLPSAIDRFLEEEK